MPSTTALRSAAKKIPENLADAAETFPLLYKCDQALKTHFQKLVNCISLCFPLPPLNFLFANYVIEKARILTKVFRLQVENWFLIQCNEEISRVTLLLRGNETFRVKYSRKTKLKPIKKR